MPPPTLCNVHLTHQTKFSSQGDMLYRVIFNSPSPSSSTAKYIFSIYLARHEEQGSVKKITLYFFSFSTL